MHNNKNFYFIYWIYSFKNRTYFSFVYIHICKKNRKKQSYIAYIDFLIITAETPDVYKKGF